MTVVANQQEFIDHYLYSAIDPITGDNFYLLGFNNVNASIRKKFFEALIEQYPEYHILLVLDNAPFHRQKELQEMEGLTPMFLPSYSPQLNPVERFYGEVQKSTANRLFQNIEIQKDVIEEEVVKWMKDTDKTQNFVGMIGLWSSGNHHFNVYWYKDFPF